MERDVPKGPFSKDIDISELSAEQVAYNSELLLDTFEDIVNHASKVNSPTWTYAFKGSLKQSSWDISYTRSDELRQLKMQQNHNEESDAPPTRLIVDLNTNTEIKNPFNRIASFAFQTSQNGAVYYLQNYNTLDTLILAEEMICDFKREKISSTKIK